MNYATTTNYGLVKPLPSTTVYDALVTLLPQFCDSVDAALTRGGIAPPNTPDLAALTGRVSTLETRPYAALHQTTAQTNLGTGWQTVTLDAETEDSHNGHAAGAAGYTVPVGQGGLYEVSGAIAFATTATANLLLQARVMVNGALRPNSYGAGGSWSQTAAVTTVPLSTKLMRLAAGDVVTLMGYNGGSAWATNATPTTGATSHLMLRRVG